MSLKINGNILKKNTNNKFWWIKLGITIILTNILFFILFSSPETKVMTPNIPAGWVEIHVKAELLTPFQKGKKVILLNRKSQIFMSGMLEENSLEPEGRMTVLVKDEDASLLIRHEMWEIIPDLKQFSLPKRNQTVAQEIRY
jgi:hypothetical protein